MGLCHAETDNDALACCKPQAVFACKPNLSFAETEPESGISCIFYTPDQLDIAHPAIALQPFSVLTQHMEKVSPEVGRQVFQDVTLSFHAADSLFSSHHFPLTGACVFDAGALAYAAHIHFPH